MSAGGSSSSTTARAAPPLPAGLVVVIAGPTAVGKSATALALSELLPWPAEIVSADSVQLYSGLDIGSNKPSESERRRCRTHLLDWLEPNSPCTAGLWCGEAVRLIGEIHSRGALPLVVGGSCMYLDWLVHGEPDAAPVDPDVRARVAEELQPFEEALDWEGGLALLQEAEGEGGQRAEGIALNDWRRLARQLEVARTPPLREGRASREGLDIRSFFLFPDDRQVLFQRIDARCMQMLRQGLLQEVSRLLSTGELTAETPAGRAIGYQQTIDYLLRPEPLEDDLEALSTFLQRFGTASRSYAVQQMRWFQRDQSFLWLKADPAAPGAVAEQILRLAQLRRADFEASAAALQAAAAAKEPRSGSVQPDQGKHVVVHYSSSLGSREEQQREGLVDLLHQADAVTRQIPGHLRRVVEAPEPVAIADADDDPGAPAFGRVYWHGRHKRWGWGAPLGKLHKQGLQLLASCGWQMVAEEEDALLPVFCWPTRNAGDFPARAAQGVPLPLVRPFPSDFSNRLDRKAELAAHLTAAGQDGIHPRTWAAADFSAQQVVCEEEEASRPSGPWFLKHTCGGRGNAVHVFADLSTLQARLDELGEKGRRGWVVQQAVAPPALRNGRKWVLRVHALLHSAAVGEPVAYCHNDMILLEHGQPFTERVSVRPAHISNTGNPKNWPRPVLVEDDDALKAQVASVVARCFAAVWDHVPRGPHSPPGGELCQLFGLDLAADAQGRLWLLEVNSYPAIASGTMDHVEPQVYTRLVRDVLRLVVLPRVDGAEPALGGFERLDVLGAAAAAARSPSS